MFRNLYELFHKKNMVSYISPMASPEQVVVDLHSRGVDVCFDQAEKLYHGIHDDGMDEEDVISICGLDA
jgi:hypothetical protein